MSQFIDAGAAIYTLLANAGYEARGTVEKDSDGQRVLVRSVGGQRTGIVDRARVQIEVIDSDRQSGSKSANDILNMLIDGPHFVPGHGLIDRVTAEGSPVEVPYKNELKNYIFNVAVESRAL